MTLIIMAICTVLFENLYTILKELRNYILRIICVRSLFFQEGFIEVCVFYLLFWVTSFLSFCVLCVFCLS